MFMKRWFAVAIVWLSLVGFIMSPGLGALLLFLSLLHMALVDILALDDEHEYDTRYNRTVSTKEPVWTDTNKD